MASKRSPRPTKVCPACGAVIPARALACRECGSDAETGWSSTEDQELSSVELPEFDEEDYRRVISGLGEKRSSGVSLWVKLVIVITLLGFVLLVILSR